MRLIDAEALKESVREKFKALLDRCEINGLVNAAPTVDAIPVDWIKLNIAISALVEDDDAANLLLVLVDSWHKSGWSLFDGVLPAEEAKKYGIKPREAVP